MPDNTDIHLGISRIKLGWVPGEYSRKAELWETQEDPGARETLRELGRENEEEQLAIPWLPEHVCKHCGVQSKAGAAGSPHLQHSREKGRSGICPTY